jgi:hypothetical protein
MSWSYTAAAAEAIAAIAAKCLEQQAGDDDPVANVFVAADGESYFYEITGCDGHGGVVGQISVCVDETQCRFVETFHIDGKGRLLDGPEFFHRILEAS